MRRFTDRLSMVKGTNDGENPPDQTRQKRFAGPSGANEVGLQWRVQSVGGS
jgi:hypothetical protein